MEIPEWHSSRDSLEANSQKYPQGRSGVCQKFSCKLLKHRYRSFIYGTNESISSYIFNMQAVNTTLGEGQKPRATMNNRQIKIVFIFGEECISPYKLELESIHVSGCIYFRPGPVGTPQYLMWI